MVWVLLILGLAGLAAITVNHVRWRRSVRGLPEWRGRAYDRLARKARHFADGASVASTMMLWEAVRPYYVAGGDLEPKTIRKDFDQSGVPFGPFAIASVLMELHRAGLVRIGFGLAGERGRFAGFWRSPYGIPKNLLVPGVVTVTVFRPRWPARPR